MRATRIDAASPATTAARAASPVSIQPSPSDAGRSNVLWDTNRGPPTLTPLQGAFRREVSASGVAKQTQCMRRRLRQSARGRNKVNTWRRLEDRAEVFAIIV